MTTISASTTLGIDLNPASYANPIVIAAGVAVSNSGGTSAVYVSGAAYRFTVRNDGTIDASGVGVYLAPGGSVTNATAASITAYDVGVSISGTVGVVVNEGTIAIQGTFGNGTLALAGVDLSAGGAVTNASGGSIVGYQAGVTISGGAGAVVNDGSIAGGKLGGGCGVSLAAGGSVTNAGGASISGGAGIGISGDAGTVVNDGNITGASAFGDGVYLYAGGSVTNTNGATIMAGNQAVEIGGGGTVVNDGSIISSGQYGVDLRSGGLVSNTSGATITGGYDGVDVAAGIGTVVNAGSIIGTYGSGVTLSAGSSVTNAITASIAGGNDGVFIGGSGGTVVNEGSLAGTVGIGVFLGPDGSLTNAAGASITGGAFGAQLSAGGTLTNAGTIAGGNGTAVAFSDAGGNLLILDPGAVLLGGVDAAANAGNALELGSAGSVGTLTGQGRFFDNLGSIAVDNGASWALAGATVLDSGELANDGQIVLDPSTLLVASLTGTGAITIDADSTLIVQGAVAAGETIVFSGAGGVLDLGDPAAMAGTIVGFGGGDITNTGRGTIANNGSIAATGGYGVIVGTGGLVTNAASASIAGNDTGILITGGTGTAVNDGAITGTARYGINLRNGGSVTNASTATVAGGIDGVRISGGPGSVVNDGSIAGTAGNGIALNSGGAVTNAATASIIGLQDGIYISGGPGSVINDASIAGQGASANGVALHAGGSVTNTAPGSIAGGGLGVFIVGDAGTVVNDGSIASAYGTGIYLGAGGSVSNAASASITGSGFGVDLYGGATLTNAGTIIGNGTAVAFYGTADNLLVLDPGYGFFGTVSGSTSASNALELASAASSGTISDVGTQFVNFGSIVVDAGAQWSLGGTITGDVTVLMDPGSTTEVAAPVATGQDFTFNDPATLILDDPATFGGTIGGLATGDVIELTGETIISGKITGTTLTLDLAGGGTQTLTVAPGESSLRFTASAGALTVACFRSGTHIATPDGQVPVETLRVGDLVRTLRGTSPIHWIGYRRIDIRCHPQPDAVLPIRIATHAFGPDLPRRDLFLSPDHAVFIDAVLVPIKHLVNGTSIAQVQATEVTYYHLELPHHEVLLAEGLPAESWLDTGNRRNFANADGVVALHPDFSPFTWEVEGYAPLIVTGPKLEAVRRRVRDAINTAPQAPPHPYPRTKLRPADNPTSTSQATPPPAAHYSGNR